MKDTREMAQEHTEFELWECLKRTRMEWQGIPLAKVGDILREVFDEAERKALAEQLIKQP